MGIAKAWGQRPLLSFQSAAMASISKKAFFFLAILYISSLSASAENEDPSLVMNYYKDSCPQAEDIIREQVRLLYKRHKNTAFSWLRNIFHDCFVEVVHGFVVEIFNIFRLVDWFVLWCCSFVLQSCDASLLLDSTRRVLSEKETDRSFGMRNFRYLETIKEALERECPGVVSCADILVLSARDGIASVSWALSLSLSLFFISWISMFLYARNSR